MKGRVLLFNHAAERVYGKPSSAMIGTHVANLYPEGTARQIMQLIRAGGGRVEGLKTEVLDTHGALVPVLLSAGLIYEGTTPTGSVGIFTDLREKVRMEQKLQQAQDQIRTQERQAIVAELAGAAAHELNQPLQTVMGYAELLLRYLDKSRNDPTWNAAEVIFAEAERMAEIVRKIGKITKYETKSYVGRARILDLDKAASDEDGTPAAKSQRGQDVSEGPKSGPKSKEGGLARRRE
jgi:PAS domain S-box-containing protein